jgi:CRP-like cAMP-binding protein
MDQPSLLTTERLTLSRDLQRGWPSRGVFVIKNVPAQTYLSVNREQAQVLEAFSEGATVPEALQNLLLQRRCPPLREFYELVLKAVRAGVLKSRVSLRPPRKALEWPGWRSGLRGLWPLAALNVAVLAGLLWRSPAPHAQFTWLGLALGIVLVALTLSAGQALAAMLVVGAGGEVYPRSRSECLRLLHLRLDLRDARLLRPREQAGAALAQTFPVAAALLLALALSPGAAPPLAAAWLLLWRPWSGGLPRGLSGLLNRSPKLDTDSDPLFHLNRGPRLHWRPWWRRWDPRVCALDLGVAALWAATVAWVAFGWAGLDAGELVRTNRDHWLVSALALASALLLVVLVRIGLRWRDGLKEMAARARRRWDSFRRRRGVFAFPDTEAALQRIAAEHPLLGVLGLLNPYDRAEIVRSWRPVTFASRDVLEVVNAEGSGIGLILSGTGVLTRLTPSGRRARVLQLEEGDFFGLPGGNVFTDSACELEYRATTPVAALVMPAGVFRRCVAEKLGATVIEDLTFKLAFLRRLQVCAHWEPGSIARFARATQLVAYDDSETLVREGQEPRWFYIVFDGAAQVRQAGKLLGRLQAGDFFGEISLLQNSAAAADVVAQGALRCLQVDRRDFLRFVARDYRAALTLERVSSARLGHPIFPLREGPVGSAQPFGSPFRPVPCHP